jgi:hypothetical protein
VGRPDRARTTAAWRLRLVAVQMLGARAPLMLLEPKTSLFPWPNVRAKLPAEAGFVSPVRDDSTTGADRAYKACRSGSA